jgi:hypothetical protein
VDDKWKKVSHQAYSVCSDSWIVFSTGHPQKASLWESYGTMGDDSNVHLPWYIATNPQRSCGFAPYIQYMLKVVANEKFYKNVAHEPLRPTVPKDPRTHHTASPSPAVAPSYTTRSGGASSSSSANSGFLKIF